MPPGAMAGLSGELCGLYVRAMDVLGLIFAIDVGPLLDGGLGLFC